jgi:hypothetical protein
MFIFDNILRCKNIKNESIFMLAISSIMLLSVYAISSSFHAIYPINYLPQSAYADGLTQENLPPASLGDREGSLFVKISPPVYTTESQENAFMQFRLFDANTNETIEFVTYDITVTKGANPSTDEEPLLRDFFQSPSGLLTIRVDPTNTTSLTIFGNRDPFLGAWVADPGGTINIRGPLLLEGGLYKFDIQIFGIDNPRNIFVPEQAPLFESFLSEVRDFNFDSNTGSFSWSMPFYYNLTRLRDNPIFVHEEIKLPKSLFGNGPFNATVNGDPVSGRTLAVDPFTDPDAIVLHYLINKNSIIELAEEWQQQQQQQQLNEGINDETSVDNQTGLMTFVLETSGGVQGDEQEQISSSSSSDLISDTGGIHASISWSTQPLILNSNSTLRINFSDAFSGGPLNADVMYDLLILDNNGTLVINKEGLIANGSNDTQTLLFPADGRYQLELHINGLITSDQDTPDLTRNGIARGYVFVP